MSRKPQHHQVQYGNTTIPYSLSFTDRETLAIHVNPDTSVSVEAPLGSELPEIEKRVLKRAAWILRQQRTFERYSVEFPPRSYVSGESYRFLGQQYLLKVEEIENGRGKVRIDRNRIRVKTRDKSSTKRVKKQLISWFRSRAREVFTERIDHWLPRFEKYNIDSPHLVVRQMKTRWGSCTTNNVITLNLKLIHVHKHLIDYVIVHELCHLVVPYHNTEFYSTLSKIMPNWEELREELNKFEF